MQVGLGEELFGSEFGDTAVKANPLRAVTVMVAEGVDVLLPLATLTLTVPLVTTTPDHELDVPLPLTVLLFESLNCQFEKVAPDGGLFTVQVALLPRVTDEGEHVRLMTLVPATGSSWSSGQA